MDVREFIYKNRDQWLHDLESERHRLRKLIAESDESYQKWSKDNRAREEWLAAADKLDDEWPALAQAMRNQCPYSYLPRVWENHLGNTIKHRRENVAFAEQVLAEMRNFLEA